LCTFIYFIIFTFTHVCIHCLGHLPRPSPLAGRPVSPSLWFCWRENINDNKKDIAFLLTWDKDGYTERLLEFLPCACVLQPELIHLYLTSALLPGHLPIVASASLGLLYLFLYSGHIKHFQVLGFLLFPYSSRAHSPLSVWPVSYNIPIFDLGL
jgi:hypothetical protein